MRRAWIVVGLLLLGVAAWFLVGEQNDSPTTLDAADVPPKDAQPGLIGTKEKTPKRPTEEADVDLPREDSEPEEWIPPGEEQIVRGTVVLVDAAGIESRVARGTLQFTVWRGNSGDTHTTEVTDGAWRARIRRGSTIAPEVLSAANANAWFPDADEPLAVSADDTLALRAVVPPPTTIRVLDAETGADLSRVHVLQTTYAARRHEHPGVRRHLLDPDRMRQSPFELQPADVDLVDHRVFFHIGRTGYAWQRLPVYFRKGGEHVVRLPKGGGLDIVLTGGPHKTGAQVRLRRGSAQGDVAVGLFPDAAMRYALSGLTPGDYLLQLEFDGRSARPEVLAATEVTIRTGTRASVTLDLPSFTPPQRVPFDGELVVPAGWPLERPHGYLTLLDAPLLPESGFAWLELGAPTPGVGGETTFPFTTPALQPGAYLFGWRGLGPVARVEISAPGTRSAHLALPPPVKVSIGIRGDEAWPTDPVREITWHAVGPKGVRSWTPTYVKRNTKTGRFHFVAPAGRLRIGIRGLGYLGGRLEEAVRAPRAKLELEVRRTASVLLRPEVSGRRVAWDLDGLVTVRSGAGGEDQLLRLMHTDAGCRLEIEEPGRYRVEIEKVDGHERPAPLDVEFVRGEPPVVVVPLVPKR